MEKQSEFAYTLNHEAGLDIGRLTDAVELTRVISAIKY